MKHTIAKYFAAAAALCLTAVGCSTLQEDKGVSEGRDIKFSASIGSFQVKATDTAFENGDAMGLYAENQVKAENVRLTWKDGALTPDTPVQWGWNQLVDESTLFYAYYPYTAEPVFREGDGNNYLEFTVQTDQSTHAAYTASDLMTASTYATPAEGTVNFAFVHRMAKLVLTVDNRLNDPVKEVYVGNVQTTGHYDIARSQDYYSLGERGSIRAGEGVTAEGAKAWSVILPSQDCQITLMLVTESGKEYVYKSENYVYFGAARRHSAQVILDETAISASFSATVYDWIDSGDFWFTQPNPLYDGPWSIVGTVYGSNWDTDFYMDRVNNAVWHYTLAYHEGELFKFRYDSGWSYDYGIEETKPLEEGGHTLVPGNQGGQNIQLARSGLYDIYLNLENSTMYVWWAGELPTVEGTIIWEGNQPLSEWTGYQLGSEKAWIDNGAQVGNEVRVYYEATNYGMFNVWSGQWENWGLEYKVEPGTGYVSFVINDYIYSCMTSIDDWGGALTVLGENVTITAITLTEGSQSSGAWSLIGSIMGSSWDKDFEMTDWEAGYWSIDFVYNDGEDFKFRKNGNWQDGDLGAGSDWTVNESGGYFMNLAQGGKNITLPKAGQWSLWMNVNDKTLSATYQETK